MAGIFIKGELGYRKDVEKLVRGVIDRNPVGKLIIAFITHTGKDLTIKPLSAWPGRGSKHCRALTDAEDHLKAAPKGVSSKGVEIREKWYAGKVDDQDGVTDDNDERYDPAPTSKAAQGGGSNALVFFTPGEWGGKSGCFAGTAGAAPDDVLLHEMVHALRIMQGLYNPVPTRNTSYTNEEEFLAIEVGNVYISANNKTHLVAGHSSHQTLWNPLNTSKGFADDRENSKLLSHYFFEWRPVFLELAHLKTARFNPFREWFNRFDATWKTGKKK